MKKISIITTGHSPFDERIYYKFARSLARNGFKVDIISSTMSQDDIREYASGKNDELMTGPINVISIKNISESKIKKIENIVGCLNNINPDIVICCEPLPLIAVSKYKKNGHNEAISISDITEWYPENYVFKYSGLKKYLRYFILLMFNIYATNKADHLIIGETTKEFRYRFLAPLKRKTIIGYYPVLEYFKYSKPPFDGKVFTLCFSGILSRERGILKAIAVAAELAARYPAISIRLKICGRYLNDSEKELVAESIMKAGNIVFEISEWTQYNKISDVLADADICIDLREMNFIYRNSLPIKIFEYMACGKPVVYPDIKPIRRAMDTGDIGFLVNPDNINGIADAVSVYIEDREVLLRHSLKAREMAEKYFNWEIEELVLLDLVNSFHSDRETTRPE